MRKSNKTQTLTIAYLVVAALLTALWVYSFGTGWHSLINITIGTVVGVFSFLILRFIWQLLFGFIQKSPATFNAAFMAVLSIAFLIPLLGFWIPPLIYFAGVFILLLIPILFAGTWSQSKKTRWAALGSVVLPLFLLGAVFYWLIQEGNDPFATQQDNTASIQTLAESNLSNPASLGPFSVDTFTYGSGTDKKRAAYAKDIRYKTPTVNASLLLPEWKGKKKKWRERYWGFGPAEFPLNARVYWPKNRAQASPLVLIVHGNHSMIDYSDGGYAYLGELLASRGMIVVSVDENFINGHWSGDFRGREMPTRAWLLLKHLAQWQQWNADESHDFHKQVDMDNIMLIGHSRGGEAVAIAAAFNRLSAYPDNAKLAFDFNFNIKSVVSIAPTDYRYHRQIHLENVNYLSLQGSYDADEVSFWGLRAFRRLQFTDGQDWMKAAVYIHRANHGQFNSSWGRSDFGKPMSWLLNTYPLLTGEDQRTTAKVFISAFAEASLKGNGDYLPLFTNVTLAGDWLPKNDYLTHFAQQGDQVLQDFEEDIDIALAANEGIIETSNLKIFREENLQTRDDGSQQNNALVIGWDHRDTSIPIPATYQISWPDSTLQVKDSVSHLLISLAPGDIRELEKEGSEESLPADSLVLDVTIRLVDTSGSVIELPVSNVKKIVPPLRSRFLKLAKISSDIIGKDWEVQLQHFALPLHQFNQVSGTFDIKSLQKIQLVFDEQLPYGILVVDDLGLR